MSLKDKINNDLKTAMKSKDKTRLQVVRSLRALILEYEKSGAADEMSADEEIKMLTSAAKKRKESIEQFSNAGRTDLADNEKAELLIIQEYLPKQLNEDEVLEEVKKLAAEIGASTKDDFPKLMPAAMKNLKGRADGKAVKEIVQKFLS